MKKGSVRKIKKIFNLYNFAILVCVLLIIASLIVLIKPDFSNISFKKDETAQVSETNNEDETKEDETEEIDEKKAAKIAIKQFKQLDEKGLKKDDLEIMKIQRSGEEYYYVSSPENTVEISVKTGEVTRINSVKVEK